MQRSLWKDMANSLMIGSAKMGVNITIIAPKSLWPKEELVEECKVWAAEAGSTITLSDSVDSVKGADVLYTDVWASMYRTVAQEVLGTTVITYKGVEMDLSKPFPKMTMTEAVKKYSGVDFDEIGTLEEARKIADEKGVEYEKRHKKGDILNAFFETFVEDKLIQPTFITNHPIEISPLTKKIPGDPEHAVSDCKLRTRHQADRGEVRRGKRCCA